jgi:hypothetical protein
MGEGEGERTEGGRERGSGRGKKVKKGERDVQYRSYGTGLRILSRLP